MLLSRRAKLAGILAAATTLVLGAAGAAFMGTSTNGSNSFTAAASFDTYYESVRADTPLFYHRMDEVAGSTVMNDASVAGTHDGTYAQATGTTATMSSKVAGKLPGNTAVHFSGNTEHVSTETPTPGPDTFSVEVWFKTAIGYTGGGLLIGLGSRRFGLAIQQDRHIYLDSVGKVEFGVNPSSVSPKAIQSTSALNDGAWHHVVGTLDGTDDGGTGAMTLYVDNVAKTYAGGPLTRGYPTPVGYWRVGGGWLGTWPNQPVNDYVNATIDEAAVYPTVLTAADVTAHFNAGNATTATAAADYKTEVLTESEYLYWRLDEPEAQWAVDSSGAGDKYGYYHLGAPTINQPVASAVDKWGNAASAAAFNGADGSVVQVNSVAGPNVFSVELWFKSTSTAGGKLIGHGGTNRLAPSTIWDRDMYLDSAGRVTFRIENAPRKWVRSTSALNNGVWHHVAVTLDGATLKMYVDGGLQAGTGTNPTWDLGTAAATGAGGVPTGYWRVGGDAIADNQPNTPAGDYVDATIDEVAVYLNANALTAGQVSTHYAAGTAAAYATAVLSNNPDLYWKFNETDDAMQAADSGSTGLQDGDYLPQAGALGGASFRDAGMRFSGACIINNCTGGTVGDVINKAAYNGLTQASPNTFTLELWFKTRTASGGLLIGLGDNTTANSTTYDRSIFMRRDGYLEFRVGATANVIVSTSALNDDAWHYAAASLGSAGMRLYVDGALVASNAAITTGLAIPTGYWRIGGDNLFRWTGNTQTWSFYFAGHLDEVAVYGSQLTTDKIEAHYYSRDRS